MRVLILLFAGGLNGCLAYHQETIELATLARSRVAPPTAPLDYADAVAFARVHNPELRRLAADARAEGLDQPYAELAVGANFQDDDAMAELNPLALLRRGRRGARIREAEANQAAALAALLARERAVAAELAAVFAVHRELESLPPLEVELDEAAFEAAGLASRHGLALATTARTTIAAEHAARRAAREGNRAALRRLLGTAGASGLAAPPASFPPVPAASSERLLQRADLVVAMTRYRVADAELRTAVRDQYPQVVLGAEASLTGGGVGGLVALRIPVGASKRARAAEARREAARHAAVAAIGAAEEEADRAASDHAHAEAAWRAAEAGLRAASLRFGLARASLEVDPGGFQQVADAAVELAHAHRTLREAALARAQARTRRAAAYGWPLPGEEVTS